LTGTPELWVVFTGSAYTSGALSLVSRLAARISIVAAHVVPYPLPLLDPPVDPAFLEQRLLSLALGSGADATVQIYLCRDRAETLDRILPAGATVVIGGRRHWWRTAEQRLARALAHHGRNIFFFDPKNHERILYNFERS
jgi:hypothetical protein